MALAVAAGVPVTFAVLHNGFPVSNVTLNAKDVWVTNDSLALAGRLNRQIDELTAGAQAVSKSIDVVQDGAEVFVHDNDLNTLERVERSRVTLVQKTSVPADAEISLGKTTMSIVDPADGKLWIINVANGLSFDSKSQKPDATLGAGGEAVVGRDGIVHATSPEHSKLYQFASAGAQPTTTSMSLPTDGQLSVVGDTAVDLDTGKNTLITSAGKRIALKADSVKIQQPGAANASALVATTDGLLTVPLAGGTQSVTQANIPAQTSPTDVSAPVWLDGCAYGAWASAQRYVQQCGSAAPQRLTIQQPTAGDNLVFRVNRDNIALNNLENGNTWVLSSKLKLVDNWDEIVPPQQSKVTKGHQKSTQESFQDTLAHRTAVNHPPIARPDQYGVRPGRTTILPVLDNDTDQDGDVLTVSDTTSIPKAFGHLDAIDGGRALQFTPASNATGGQSFRYTVSDGRGGVADANVDLSIVPPSENRPPKELRQASVTVEAGKSIQYDVLTDWQDPDGDDLELKTAAPTSADSVQFTPDGYITFQNKSGQAGTKTVSYSVTDGTATVSGKLNVTVKPEGSVAPVGTPDFAQMFAGSTTVVQPLINDLSPSGAPLTLVSVSGAPATAAVTTNLDKGEVSITSGTPGTIYLTYKLAAGDEQSEGIIRVDVLANPKKDLPPIAVKDVGYVRAGQSTTVKVLDNDVSPLGRVLAVQSVDTDHTSQSVKVELLNNTNVRITAPNGLTSETQFTYTISDGENTSVAGVTVVPVAPIVNRQPPIAVDDKATVRADDIASVDVLANDYSPDQEQISLEPDLADTSNDGGGLAFVNGDTVRYEAPDKAGQYYVIYRITDQYGETATGRLTFNVTAKNPANDQPPVPEKQTARAFSGSTVRVNVPLDGIDPDGDSVVLDGIVVPPTLGSIVDSGPTWFDYKAFTSAAGTDKFMYNVKDAYGAVGTGEIDVGVIPRSVLAAPPNAVDDNVEVKPGKTVSVQALLNDSDPNLYPLTLTKKLISVSPALKAHVSGSKIIITAPAKQGGYSLRYGISNGQGGTDSAYVTVKVTKLAKPMYPSATDDYITDSQVHGGKAIKVNVESLINNPNGEDGDLLISAEGPNASKATVNQAAGTVTVTPGDERYAVAYRVTDPSDKTLTASAFIVVPPANTGKNIGPPHLKYGLKKQIVPMNGTKTWKLSDILTVPSGKPAIITAASTVHASSSDGSSSYVDNKTIRFTPAKDYRGTAAITFQVTDGTSANDPNGRKALITLPVTVGDPNSDDVPPTFTALNEPIQAGEAATVIDLRDSTSDPNRNLISQFSYGGLSGSTSSVSASLNGSKLSMSAPLGVQPGATATLHFTIHYKSFTVPGTVRVTVVKSTRPLTQAVEDDVKGQRAKSSTVNVLANDLNPYADENKPLTLTKATVENSAQTSATVSFTPDGEVTVNPDASFIGVVSVVYTVRDASKDPSRDVQGRLLLTVRDVPDQPDPPTIVSESNGSVTISWKAPATNGEDILDYTITPSGGQPQKTVDASAAQTTITGLTNAQSYTFQISARNILGDSAISAASDSAIPYTNPSAPPSASISASSDGSGALSMSWGAANGNGRDVTKYQWSLNGGPMTDASGLSASATGTVGDSYSFTVVAVNPAGPSSARTSNSVKVPLGAPSVSLSAPGGAGDYSLNASYGSAKANGYSDSQVKYSWALTGFGSGSSDGGSSFSKTGSASTGYTLTVTATVNGVSSSGSASATTPGAPPQPSYSLCYGPPYTSGSTQDLVGVNYANIGGSHTLKLQGGFTSHTTIVGGTGQWLSASHISRSSAGDLNQTVTLLVDGNAALSERWGDAGPC